MGTSRRGVLAAAGLVLAAGCTGFSRTDDPSTTTDTSTRDDPTTTTADRTTTTGSPEPTVTPAGALAWTQGLEGSVTLGPAVADGRLYLGTDAGRIHVLTPEGDTLWTAEVGGAFFSGVGVDRSPVVAGDTVYLTTGEQSGPIGEGYALYALDVATGDVRWRQPGEGGRFLGLLGVADGRVYAGTSNDNLQDQGETLYALDTEGRELWTADVGDPREAAVGPDGLAIGMPNTLRVFSADGTRRFDSDRFGDYGTVSLSFAGGHLLVPRQNEPQGLYALAPTSGDQRWAVERFVNSLVIGDRIYTGGKSVAAYGFDGSPIWESDTEAFAEARHDGLVYASTFAEGGGAEALALSAADGRVAWRHTVDGETAETVAVDDDLAALIQQRSPVIEGLDPTTGERRVRFEATTARTISGPTVMAGRLVVAEGDTVYALSPQ